MQSCPVCKEPAVSTCKCPRLDSHCKNGHEWHYCPVHFDKVNLGRSDHASSDCTCPKMKLNIINGDIVARIENVEAVQIRQDSVQLLFPDNHSVSVALNETTSPLYIVIDE